MLEQSAVKAVMTGTDLAGVCTAVRGPFPGHMRMVELFYPSQFTSPAGSSLGSCCSGLSLQLSQLFLNALPRSQAMGKAFITLSCSALLFTALLKTSLGLRLQDLFPQSPSLAQSVDNTSPVLLGPTYSTAAQIDPSRVALAQTKFLFPGTP